MTNYYFEENRIIFDNNEVFKHLPLLGYGSQGDVYKMRIGNDTYAIKVFNGLKNENEKDYEGLLKLDIGSYVSPKKLLYINDEFKGYIMEYVHGKDLGQKKLDVPIFEFYNSYKRLTDDTELLTELNYTIYDTFLSNVMYDEGFKMIDLDDYGFKRKDSYQELTLLNRRRLNQTLVNIFVNSSHTASLFFSDVDLTKLMADCNSGRLSFDKFYTELVSRAYEASDMEINNVSEIGKVLKNVKK